LGDAPGQITVIALVLTVIIVIATKAWTGRGTPLRGGLPSGHAAIAFAAWVAATYIVGDPHRFVVSALTFIMALLVGQTRVESGIHSPLEVASGAAIGALVTLTVFQFVQCGVACDADSRTCELARTSVGAAGQERRDRSWGSEQGAVRPGGGDL